ncbi:uncharacterized protein LOC135934020 [Cloeon dipterum]|uniref:uncharacterized protein LOC135934020 n=1 Tax=Cloeon dipterum TaxID=197152 RepID=UPI003220827E
MRQILHIALVVFFLIIYIFPDCNGRRSLQGSKVMRRKTIIKCCGKKSCLSVRRKTHPRNITRETTVFSSKQSPFEVQKTTETSDDVEIELGMTDETTQIDPGAGVEITTNVQENLKQDVTADSATTPEVSKIPISKEATSTTEKPLPDGIPSCGQPLLDSCQTQGKVLQMQLGTDSTEGRYLKSFGRKYFISNLKLNVTTAKRVCCAQKMQLLSITSASEHQYVASLNDVLKQSAMTYWTSGTVGKGGSFWCSSEQLVPIPNNLNWLQKNASNPNSEFCLTFEMNVGDASKSGLKFADCNAEKLFICETTEPTCPTPAISKNTAMFDEDGNILTPQVHGIWENGANATFLFGFSLATWSETWKECSKFGMMPLSFSSKIELDFVFDLLGGWGSSINYWTAGTREDYATKGPVWCTDRAEINKAVVHVQNAANESIMGKFDCIAFLVKKIATNVLITFDGSFDFRNCSIRQFLACKGPLTPKPSFFRQTCPRNIARNLSLFNLSTGFLNEPSSFGQWVSKCNKFFVIADPTTDQTNETVKITWDEARKRCNSIGFRLISFDSREKFDCLVNVSQNNLAPFWTSGAYLDCKSSTKYVWCGSNRNLNMNDVVWDKNQPPQSATKTCISGVFNLQTGVSLQAVDCDSSLSFICEADNTEGHSLAYAKYEQCQILLQVSKAEVDSLFLGLSLSSKLKCYMRCLGESLSLIDSNGRIVDLAIINLIQSVVMSVEQVEKSFDILNICKNLSGADACESEARIFECGMQRAPDKIYAMVTYSVTDFQTAPLIGYPNDSCPYDVSTCTLNATAADNVANNKTVDGMLYFVEACGKKYQVSEESKNYADAARKCCEMGMTHAYFNSYDDFKCFLAADEALSKSRAGKQYSVSVYAGRSLPIFTWCPSKVPVEIGFKWGRQLNALVNKCAYIGCNNTFFLEPLVPVACDTEMQFICMSV